MANNDFEYVTHQTLKMADEILQILVVFQGMPLFISLCVFFVTSCIAILYELLCYAVGQCYDKFPLYRSSLCSSWMTVSN